MRLRVATPNVRSIQGDKRGGETGGRAKVYREVTGVDSENIGIWRHLKRGGEMKGKRKREERGGKRTAGEGEGQGDENRNGRMEMGGRGEVRRVGRENGSKVGKHKNGSQRQGERSTRFKIGGFVALGTGPRNSDGQIRFKRTGTVADKEAREREQLKGRDSISQRERRREGVSVKKSECESDLVVCVDASSLSAAEEEGGGEGEREDNYVRMKHKTNFQWTGGDGRESTAAATRWGEERGWTDLMGWDEMDGWMDGE
ncbi:uncharacterized protein BO96DRAFT_345163 [Aspergillus niger CBS 101883]|uniref:Contig An07c0240, genomic contig n=2 Tax=Aspergillus niger TaxID=5061 RepID=A2QP40_ASPNC|nr:uncharacterized protein BO96DRAFT_345163 [Aspergillus niger CBS 101883]XP_059601039.1 uncharacterized protein An07g08110 [Aspergillus niger]PYH53379.1 hypothetical protein BO96DRAFT_345163 [Aspergillus niger CBS 101883]CAK39627.1 unnamed protein product [Aspergillus niger]